MIKRTFLLFLILTSLTWPSRDVFASGPECTAAKLQVPMSAKIYHVDKKPILLLAGIIEGNSGEIVGPAIKRTNSYTQVWLCSGGGAVAGGKDIGKALNEVKATVRTPDNYSCASACTIAFMGGYVRIIDKHARFVTHASSSAKGFGIKKSGSNGMEYSYFMLLYCNKSHARKHCEKLRTVVNELSPKLACKSWRHVIGQGYGCMYNNVYQPRRNENTFFANAFLTNFLHTNPVLVYDSIDVIMKEQVESEVELLRYFQTMLLDGQAQHLDWPSYNHITAKFVPTNIYKLPESDEYYRNFERDYEALKAASGKEIETYAIWQAMLTDSELSIKTQLTQFIRKHKLSLGYAGVDAIKMYDSMRTCQIQSSCRLEPHSAFALGYHNIGGTE